MEPPTGGSESFERRKIVVVEIPGLALDQIRQFSIPEPGADDLQLDLAASQAKRHVDGHGHPLGG